MALESASFIDGLVASNPIGGTDPKSQGDDHIRLLKSVLKSTFPNLTGAVTLTQAQINAFWTRNVIAGDGLTGGGTLDADRTLAIGTPTTSTLLTENAVTADSHSHKVEIPDATDEVAGLMSAEDKEIFDYLVSNTGAFITGDIKWTARKSAPSGWLIANGNTIGNAASGGTARANADTITLFELLWADFSNTELPIQDSSGVAASRGASAAADFAANKRMPIPDLRGRVVAGWDNLSSVVRLTAPSDDTFGGVGGFSTHTLITGELAAHTHTGTATEAGAHTHTFVGQNQNTEGSGSESRARFGFSGTITTTENGAHTHTLAIDNAGGGSAHNNTQPTIILNALIKL